MKNAIGNYLKELQEKTGENQKEMIEKLDVHRSFYFAVCNGSKRCPDEWYDKICRLYNLDEKERKDLTGALIASNHNIRFMLDKLDDKDKNLVLTLANMADSLTSKQKEMIWQIINGG